MAEIGLAASIIAVIQISEDVITRAYKYGKAVKNAEKDIKQLNEDLQDVQNILKKLETLAKRTESSGRPLTLWPTLISLKEENGPLSQCKSALESLQKELAPIEGYSKFTRSLQWPRKAKSVGKLVEKTNAQKKYFLEALNIDEAGQALETGEQVTNIAKTQSDHKEISQSTNAKVTELVGAQNESKVKTVIDWLSSGRYDETHIFVKSQRQPNTGQWFIDKFRTWLADTDRLPFFWCQGNPGTGKSVLMSAVVDYVESQSDVHIAYIYFNYKQWESQTASRIYASLVAQLLNTVPVLQTHAETLYQKCDNGKKTPAAGELFDVLTCLPSSYKIVLAFDALDEASVDTRNDLLSRFARLDKTSLLFFITSRPGITIRSISTRTKIENVTAQTSDLKEYIREHLQSDEVQTLLDDDSQNVVPEIEQNLISHAAGMFLLVVFQVKHICSKTCAAEMLEASKTMPSDPDSVYERTMEQINSQSDSSQIELANRVLSYLVFAKRDLSIHELIEALAVKPGTTKLDGLWKRPPQILIKVCRGLVVIDDSSRIIRLAHLTLQDYLAERYKPDIEKIQKDICLTCITYLSFDAFKDGPCPNQKSLRDRKKAHVFLDYAGRQLTAHLLELKEKDAFSEEIFNLAISIAISESFLQIHFNTLYPSGASALHIAAMLGQEAVMARLLLAKEGVDPNSKDAFGETALSWAVRYGHEGVVKLLLDSDEVDTQAKDIFGEAALSQAAINGREAVVKLLLDSGKVDADGQDEYGRTALWLAARHGHEAVVKLLLDPGKLLDVESKDIRGQAPLMMAAMTGDGAVAKLLLDSGKVDANSWDAWGRTALSYAAENGHEAVVKLLLDSGKVDADSKDRFDQTALSMATRNGREAVVKLLLVSDKVQDGDSKDAVGRTALSYAAEKGDEALVKLLLASDKVQDGDSKDSEYGQTALSYAAENGHEAVAKLLLASEKVQDGDSKDAQGQTALSYATQNRHEAVMKLLLASNKIQNAGLDVKLLPASNKIQNIKVDDSKYSDSCSG